MKSPEKMITFYFRFSQNFAKTFSTHYTFYKRHHCPTVYRYTDTASGSGGCASELSRHNRTTGTAPLSTFHLNYRGKNSTWFTVALILSTLLTLESGRTCKAMTGVYSSLNFDGGSVVLMHYEDQRMNFANWPLIYLNYPGFVHLLFSSLRRPTNFLGVHVGCGVLM